LQNPGGFYVFNGDFAYRMDPGRPLRFHWDHLAVNPELLGQQPPVPTNTPQPTQTALPSATATNTPTAVPSATPTQQALCEVLVRIGGVEQWRVKPPEFCA
jgi:hypothetical protein